MLICQKPTSAPLTARQQEVLEYLKKHQEEHGCPPTVREIGAAIGVTSPNGVMCHLKALEKKGSISRQPNHARMIRILSPDGPMASAEASMVRVSIPPRLLSPAEAVALSGLLLESARQASEGSAL